MATTVGSAAGFALGGPVGQAIGAAIGSYIDQAFLFPLFQDDVEGPRIYELELHGADEGTPANFSTGPECRMPGTIIWTSNLIEVKEAEEAGKGGGPEIERYTYFVNIAVAACRNEISNVLKIWAEGKKLYDSDPDINITASNLTATVKIKTKWNIATQSAVEYERLMTISSPNGGEDLSDFRSGKNVVVSGWSVTANNGTFKCKKSTFDKTTGISTVVLDVTGTLAAADGPGDTVTLFQDLPEFNPSKINGITIYTGTQTQVADSLIESSEGTGNVPGFRGTSYVVLNRLALADYGNRIPNFTFLIETEASQTVGGAVSSILTRTGRPASEFDTTGLTDTFRGYTIRGPQPVVQSLQPVMMGYDVLANEDQGVMTFFNRANADTKTIVAADLAAHESGGDASRVMAVTDPSAHRLPSECTVRYLDPLTDYQWGSQRERRINWTTNNRARVSLPLVFDAADARDVAARLLWTPWANNQIVKIQLPPSYMDVQVGDRLTVTAYGKTWTILTTKLDLGWNYLIQIEGVIEQTQLLSFTSTAEEPQSGGVSTTYFPPESSMVLMDIGPLDDGDLFTAGFYFGVSTDDPTVTFNGGQLFESTDGGTNYTFLQSVGSEASLGFTDSVLGDATTGFWDRVNTVDVTMNEGSLESKTEIEVLNGANRAFIGTEVIGFMTATVIGTNQYRLSDLIRGLLDTRDQTANHQDGEEFVHLNTVGVGRISQNLTAVGQARKYKYVPTGLTLADVTEQDLTPNAQAMRPYRTVHIEGSRDGSNNLTVDFVRCNRSSVRILQEGGVGLVEPSESYEVDFLDAPGGNVLRTKTVTTNQVTYTAAEQTTDGLTPGDPVDLEIFQISSQVGRGNTAAATV